MAQTLQANLFAGLDLVAILQTGAAGLAVILIFLSYRLVSETQTKLFDQDFNDGRIPEGWLALVSNQARQIYCFMGLAAVFFFASVGSLLWQHNAKSDITLMVSPYEDPFPQVFVQDEEGEFKETGHARLAVESGRLIEIRAGRIYDRVATLEGELAQMEAKLAGLRAGVNEVTASTPLSGESGL